MSSSWLQPVPAAPARPLDEDGTLKLGTYEGACADTSLDRVVASHSMGPLWRLRSEKRWQWFGAMDDDLAIGGAILRAGYLGQIFIWVFDRRRLQMLADISMPCPPPYAKVSDRPNEGTIASFDFMGQRIKLVRTAQRIEVNAKVRQLELSLVMHEAQLNPMTAICPVPNDRVNVTQKQAGLDAEGVVRVGKQSFVLSSSAVGFLDYSHGLLAYETDWRWAIGAGHTQEGQRLGFNFVEGFNAGLENVVWIDGAVHAAGPVQFLYNPLTPWTPWFIRSADDQVRLTLYVDGIRSQDVQYGFVQSRYIQPIGRWVGHIGPWAFEQVIGVAEDHLARW